MKARMVKVLYLILCSLVGGSFLLLQPATVQAGVYDADGEVTYKEYVAPHTVAAGYTGGCPVPIPPDEKNRWYIEPSSESSGCTKTLKIMIPDNVQGALRAEIYVDFWRNQQQGSTSAARFRINNSPTVYNPSRADDWARTPYIANIPLTALVQGENSITFWTQSTKLYHVHDVVIRVYHDDTHPLVAGAGSDVTPPDGQLLAVGGVNPDSANVLMVDSNTLLLEASASNGATLVEFHGFYEGYDEDNDGAYRDWHSRTLLSCFPGGVPSTCAPFKAELGATLDHIGTAAAVSPVAGDTRDDSCSWGATIICTWNLGHITNQAGVRFKIRVVDAAGNVREAAGGLSAAFKLVRNNPTAAFLSSDFPASLVLKSGTTTLFEAINLNFPAGTRALFDKAYLISSLWNNPEVRVNGSGQFDAFRSTESSWALSIRDTARNNDTLPLINTLSDTNIITYSTRANSYGEFIERPGPMIVLRRSAASPADNTAPVGTGTAPVANATGVREDTNIVVNVTDTGGVGVDRTSLVLKVNGVNVTNQAKLTGFSQDYTLTYDPPTNFSYLQNVTVEVEACDLLNNCLGTSAYTFTIRDADGTPPIISNIAVLVGPDYAQITWTTNEPATSVVDYGLDTNYGLNLTDASLLTKHKLTLPGLAATTTYHFRITSVDEGGNSVSSADQTFQTRQSAALVVDDFNYCELDGNVWEFVNPLGDATVSVVNGQQLKISVPGGLSHEPAPSGNIPNAAPRIMQNAIDPNGLKVKFESGVNQVIQQQGVIIEQDANNYMRLGFDFVNGKTMFYATKVGGTGGSVLKSYEFAPNALPGPLYMTVSYNPGQNRWRVFMSVYEDSSEGDSGGFNFPLTVNKIGVFAGNSGGASAPAFEAIIDYVDDIDAPLIGEDDTPLTVAADAWPVGKGSIVKSAACGSSLTLTAQPAVGWSFAGWSGAATGTIDTVTVPAAFGATAVANFVQNTYTIATNVVGNGTVTQSPLRANYIAGSPVKLTATPAIGWRFDGWSGDATGIINPLNLTATSNQQITANFVEIRPTLMTAKVGNGTITVTPLQENYTFNQPVSVTAVADAGWSFAGWSGAVTSTDATVTLTMDNDKSLVATFTQDNYTLTTSKVGEGTITVTPAKPTYLFGEQVTISAVPATGWRFTGWSGASSDTNPSITLVIDGNKTLTATFTQNQYTLTALKVGNGTLTVAPLKPTYLQGEQVAVTATPETGWNFVGWSGDALGTNPTITLVMDGNKTVNATFAQNQYALTVLKVGNGTVTVSPVKPTYAHGDKVTLEVTPDAGWGFIGWTGDVTNSASSFDLIMNANKTITANFQEAVAGQSTLTTRTVGSGSSTVTPLQASYPMGTEVTLTAVPNEGWIFSAWSGDATGTTNPLKVIMDGNKVITLTFVKKPVVLSILGGSNGTVERTPQQDVYAFDDVVTLKATPNAGYRFGGWVTTDSTTGAEIVSMENPLTITLKADIVYEARFVSAGNLIFLPMVNR